MAHKAKDNKAHHTSQPKHTSTPFHKRPSKQRAPFGENTGTVQPRVEQSEVKKDIKKK